MKKFDKINEAEVAEETAKKTDAPAGAGLIDIKKGPKEVLAAASKLDAKILRSGKTDATKDSDEKIQITAGTTTSRALKPTQSEIGTSNSLDDQFTNQFNATANAISGKNLGPDGGSPILTFKSAAGEYILDGHHRWSQFRATAPDVKINTAVISADGVKTEQEALALCHVILVALYGKSPTKPFDGQNIFELGKEGVKKYCLDNKDKITDEVKQMMKKTYPDKIKEGTVEELADFWSTNLASKKEDPKGIEVGKISRMFMPQPGDAAKFGENPFNLDVKNVGVKTLTSSTIGPLASGDINYLNPQKTDVKESRVIKTYEKFIQNYKKY